MLHSKVSREYDVRSERRGSRITRYGENVGFPRIISGYLRSDQIPGDINVNPPRKAPQVEIDATRLARRYGSRYTAASRVTRAAGNKRARARACVAYISRRARTLVRTRTHARADSQERRDGAHRW